MEARIGIEKGSLDDLHELLEWLNDESDLRGRTHIVQGPVAETELGSVPDLLAVTLGSGGAGAILASSLITWLQTRKTIVKVRIEAGGRSIMLDLETIHDVTPALHKILEMSDDN